MTTSAAATRARVAAALVLSVLAVLTSAWPAAAAPRHDRHWDHLAHEAHLRRLGVPQPGWRMVYAQDFTGSTLPAGWGAYSGQPGGDPDGYWRPANVTVSGGLLHLRAEPGASGGVSFWGDPHTYGMWLVRMRGDDEPGLAFSDIALLWPADNSWPPEVDFYEDAGGSRLGYAATLHPGPGRGDDCCRVQESVSNDAAAWHTYGVIWTATAVIYTLDGRTVGTVRRGQLAGGARWPSIPMNLDLQSQNLGGAQPGGVIETMTVDWVKEYVR